MHYSLCLFVKLDFALGAAYFIRDRPVVANFPSEDGLDETFFNSTAEPQTPNAQLWPPQPQKGLSVCTFTGTTRSRDCLRPSTRPEWAPTTATDTLKRRGGPSKGFPAATQSLRFPTARSSVPGPPRRLCTLQSRTSGRGGSRPTLSTSARCQFSSGSKSMPTRFGRFVANFFKQAIYSDFPKKKEIHLN